MSITYTPTAIGSLIDVTTAQTAITSNFTNISTAFTDALSLSGSTPNQMESVLDMNSNYIINLPAPISLSSPLRLGDLPTNPTTINLGFPSLIGDVTGPANNGPITTTVNAIHGTTITGATGSGNLVFSINPTFTGTVTINGSIVDTGGGTFPSVILKGATSGTTTLVAVATASGTLTVPSATDTLVARATTDALTNKTINGLIITTTTGTLTIANGKTVTLNNTYTFNGTDSAVYTFPATTDSLAGLTNTNTFTGQNIHLVPRTITSAAGAALDDLKVSAATTTLTGSTTTNLLAKVGIYQPTLTDVSAVTVSKAASLYIDNAPLAAGSVTITNPYSLYTAAGDIFHAGANEAGTYTDGFGAGRNALVGVQRIVTNLAALNIGLGIDLQNNNTSASQTSNGLQIAVTTPSGNSTAQTANRGLQVSSAYAGTGGLSISSGANFTAGNTGTNTVTTATAFVATIQNSGAGTQTTSDGIQIATPLGTASGTSTWTNINGIEILDQKPSGAGTNTLTNPPSAILINSQTASGAFAIKQSGSGINSFASSIIAQSGTSIPAGGTAGAGYSLSSTTNFGIYFGSGAPTLSAAQGSLYLRSDGSSTSTRLYVNTNGSTTWTNVTTAA